jgi:hypothetical protein
MNTIWTHEEAKNSFDSLMEEALAHHAQIIELKNQQKVIVISLEDYKKNLKPKNTLGSVDVLYKKLIYIFQLDILKFDFFNCNSGMEYRYLKAMTGISSSESHHLLTAWR